MIKVKIELNKHQDNKEYCSPCLLITEEETDEKCPIILPEDMETVDAILLTDKLKTEFEKNFKTVKEVKNAIYG